jgi:hypothetical protein
MTSSTDVWHGPRIFTSNYQNAASINLDGVDHLLTLTRASEKDSRKHNPQIGERSTYWYSGEGLRIRIDYVLTKPCPSDDEKCEVFYYRATLKVTVGHHTTEVFGPALCGT